MRLDSKAAAAGYRFLACDTLPSTNTRALELARGGERGPLWIVARRQTAGRGRRGRHWISPAGNLYATVLLWDPASPDQAAALSFVAALAAHDAIRACASSLHAQLALKWPNDILCGGAKLAGILIESESVAGKLAVAVGIGVNCLHHPAQTAYPATDLAACGAQVTAEELFCALSGSMVQRLAQWHRGAGFAAIRADWIARSRGIGQSMRVRTGDCELRGCWEAVDEEGQLLLRLADGSLRTITAGDVLPAATAVADRAPPAGRVE